MSNKIWNFDILVDDCFVNFNTKKQEINPDHNDRLLSVLLMALKMAVGDIVNSKNLFSVILQKQLCLHKNERN